MHRYGKYIIMKKYFLILINSRRNMKIASISDCEFESSPELLVPFTNYLPYFKGLSLNKFLQQVISEGQYKRKFYFEHYHSQYSKSWFSGKNSSFYFTVTYKKISMPIYNFRLLKKIKVSKCINKYFNYISIF